MVKDSAHCLDYNELSRNNSTWYTKSDWLVVMPGMAVVRCVQTKWERASDYSFNMYWAPLCSGKNEKLCHQLTGYLTWAEARVRIRLGYIPTKQCFRKWISFCFELKYLYNSASLNVIHPGFDYTPNLGYTKADILLSTFILPIPSLLLIRN